MVPMNGIGSFFTDSQIPAHAVTLLYFWVDDKVQVGEKPQSNIIPGKSIVHPRISQLGPHVVGEFVEN